jgi:HK97 family phage prohead protease
MEPDCSGFVSRANTKCTDGRVIMPNAFAHQDGATVSVVYQHNHNDINQVLGYAVLSNKEDGLWGDVYFNDTPGGRAAKAAVDHKSLNKFSVWAKDLVERGEFVHSGEVQEVSVVLSGANPGSIIERNILVHGNIDEDVMVFIGGEIEHADKPEDAPPVEEQPKEDKPEDAPPAEDGKSVADVLDTLSDEQELAVNAFIDDVVKEAVTTALSANENGEIQHDNIEEGTTQMTEHQNAFERGAASTSIGTVSGGVLKHDDMAAVLGTAKGLGHAPSSLREVNEGNMGGSLRELIRSKGGQELMHADTYGIDNIEVLFPDAQKLRARPDWVDRRQDWVKVFMSGTSHSPFSRVKTMYADITADEARAKGYIKANQKTEEVFPVFARSTGPTWVIKKQKLDRQDIIDIVDFDVVAWMKAEMRGKLDEEIARAALFGDGRPTMVNGSLNPDKIKDPGAAAASGDGIRAVVNDHELYATTYDIPLDVSTTGQTWNVLLDGVTEAGEFYLGSGNKTAFMPFKYATRLLTIRDDWGKRLYRNLDEVAGDMDVSRIVRVPTELFPEDVLCIVLDLSDYNFGTNRGGEITMFDDFDINFNQYHYLIETYLSGALTVPYAAQIFKRVDTTDTLVVPVKPGFNATTGVVTIPTVTGVTYTDAETGDPLVAGAQAAIAEGDTWLIEAVPADDTYYFGTNDDRVDTWSFTRDEA